MQLVLSIAAASKLALLPGCPVESQESLGNCMIGKSAWAFSLYVDGVVDGFITSGGAVHTPFNEAVAGAMALEAMGVPPERIWLDPWRCTRTRTPGTPCTSRSSWGPPWSSPAREARPRASAPTCGRGAGRAKRRP